jgi:hypothetical protein
VCFLEKGFVFISSLATDLLHGGVAVDGYKRFRRCSDILKFCWFYLCTGIAITWFVRSNATNLIKGVERPMIDTRHIPLILLLNLFLCCRISGARRYE